MKNIPLFILALGMIACKSKKESQVPEKKIPIQIIIGESGGFTGASFEYTISGDGKVFYEATGINASRDTFDIPREEVELWRKRLDSMNFHQHGSVSATGNLNRFLEYSSGSKKTRIGWAMPGKRPPAGVPELFENIRGRLQNK